MSDFLFLVAIDPNTGAAELCEGGVYAATPPADSEYAGNTLTRAAFDREYYGNQYGHEYELWSDMRGATIDGNVRSSLEDWQLAAAGVAVAPVTRQTGSAVYDPRHETVEGVATLYKRSPAGVLVARDTLRMAANVDRDSAERYARERWHDKLTSDHAISIRVAGDSVPAFIAMTPTPTVAAAIAYARDVLPSGAIICGSVVPVGDVPIRNVLFCLAGDRTRRVLSVWFEGSSLYGEW